MARAKEEERRRKREKHGEVSANEP